MTCVQLVFVSPYKVALGRKEEKNHELKTSEMSCDLTLEFRNAPDFLTVHCLFTINISVERKCPPMYHH